MPSSPAWFQTQATAARAENEQMTRKLRLAANDLDAERAERERATAELIALGPTSVAQLRETLRATEDEDLKFRVERILNNLLVSTRRMTGDQLRRTRAIAVLEQIGSPAAGQVLERLADGDPEASTTQDARSALDRLRANQPR